MALSIDLSIIIPCYNEQDRIALTIEKLVEATTTLHIAYEIILVNDGSHDKTYETIKHLAILYPQVQIVSYTVNQGKGFAVKSGVQKSCGGYYLIMDADLATDLDALPIFWSQRQDADCIIGNRKFSHLSLLRKLGGIVAHKIITTTLHLSVQDTQCGFKLLSSNTKYIWDSIYAHRWGYDFELLYLLQKSHHIIKELSVKWVSMPGSKVTLFSYPATLIELYKIVRKHHIIF